MTRWPSVPAATARNVTTGRRKDMSKIRFDSSGALGLLTLANPPLNLFDEELIADLRAAVQLQLRGLLVRAEGKHFSGGADVRTFMGKSVDEARQCFTSHLRWPC